MSECEKFKVGPVEFEAVGNRVLIEEDEFRSGYECKTCNGSGKLTCQNCKGAGRYERGAGTQFKCSECEGTGKTVCGECRGAGGVIAIPEVAQRRPTTGKVVSVGEKCTRIKAGMSVLYTNFSGHVIDLQDGTVLRILREDEILCLLSGHLEFRLYKRQADFVPV